VRSTGPQVALPPVPVPRPPALRLARDATLPLARSAGLEQVARRLARWRAPPLALAAVLALLPGCRGGEGERQGPVPGDSLAKPPPGAPAAPMNTDGSPAAGAPASERGGADDTTAAGEGCPQDSRSPERLRLEASWEDGHVRVRGVAEKGAGNALSLGLSQRGQFVYDQIFKSDLLSVIQLGSDTVDVTSVDYEPSKSEQAAFARTGAGPLDRSVSLCVDVTLYEKGSLDLLAARHLEVAGSPE
jgi:hypothetical protein